MRRHGGVIPVESHAEIIVSQPVLVECMFVFESGE
jgi:hypothetical protein